MHLNDEDCDSAKGLEEILYVIMCTNNHSLRAIPQCESEQLNEMVKNLLVLVNFRVRTRI